MAWFLRDNQKDGHVPKNLRSGLVWASKHMGFSGLEVEDSDAVKAADSQTRKRPTPAVSASIRMWYYLEQAACDTSLSAVVRYYAAAFCVCIIAALRGIDAQRSSIVEKFTGSWHCCAYDSKTHGRRIPMPWSLCLTSVSGVEWWHPLDRFWDSDFIFPSLSSNDVFDSGASVLRVPASGASILRHLRAILVFSKFASPEVCKAFRRHSFRHLLAHCARGLGFSKEKAEALGRWGWLKTMSVRYAAEVEFADYNKSINEITAAVRAALEKVPIREWPPVGGWEILLHSASADQKGLDEVRRQLSVLLVEKDELEADASDSEDEGQSDPIGKRKRLASAEKMPDSWSPPAGWKWVPYNFPSGPRKRWEHPDYSAKPLSLPALFRYLSSLSSM